MHFWHIFVASVRPDNLRFEKKIFRPLFNASFLPSRHCHCDAIDDADIHYPALVKGQIIDIISLVLLHFKAD